MPGGLINGDSQAYVSYKGDWWALICEGEHVALRTWGEFVYSKKTYGYDLMRYDWEELVDDGIPLYYR